MDPKDKVEGEGSYTGTKDYNKRTKKFVNSGKVEEAANDAAPKLRFVRCGNATSRRFVIERGF